MMSFAHVFALAVAVQAAPDRVEVLPASAEVGVDAVLPLTARVLDAEGAVIEGAAVTWVAVTPELVSVDASGQVTGLRPGKAQVAAMVGGTVVGFADLTVPQLGAATLEVAAPGAIVVGTSAPISLAATTRLGEALTAPVASFTSDAPAVASVDALGRVYGLAPGSATITVRSGVAEEEVEVSVEADPGFSYSLEPAASTVRTGDVVRFRAGANLPSGAGGPELLPAWTVAGVGAQIDADGAEGVFVAEDPGRYVVYAVIGEGVVRTANVEVTERISDSELIQVGRGPISSHHSGDMWVFEGVDGRDYVYVGTYMHDWMKVWDVTDSGAPVLTDSIQLDARRINDVKIHPDNHIGIVTREGASNRRNGMVLLDLADPAHPEIISRYDETLTGGVHNVWILGDENLVYACHNGTSEMHIIDISDPANPVEVGRWGLDKQGKTLHDVIVQDGYAYLSYWNDGVIMLDVGAGTHQGTAREPAFVSQFKYPIGNTHVAWRHGRYLYLGDEIFPPGWDPERPIEARGFIHVVDYSDIENPVEVAWYEVPEAGVHNVWAEGDRLYLGYYQAGLRVLDISGELRGNLYEQGREVAAFVPRDGDMVVPNWPMTWGAQIHKGRIYSSDLNSGIWITELRPKRVVF
ncbi:MAG: Ig-like domain-containing protein [Gammaproteobacteria bacterium]|nr:Ig-like domain-containing protein [Gammaproteobacteria bacterium]